MRQNTFQNNGRAVEIDISGPAIAASAVIGATASPGYGAGEVRVWLRVGTPLSPGLSPPLVMCLPPLAETPLHAGRRSRLVCRGGRWGSSRRSRWYVRKDSLSIPQCASYSTLAQPPLSMRSGGILRKDGLSIPLSASYSTLTQPPLSMHSWFQEAGGNILPPCNSGTYTVVVMAEVMQSQELCRSYAVAGVMQQKLCSRRSYGVAEVMQSQKLCSRRSYAVAEVMQSQKLCSRRSYAVAEVMQLQKLYSCRSYAVAEVTQSQKLRSRRSMQSQRLCSRKSYAVAEVMQSQKLCNRRSYAVTEVMQSQKLCSRRSYAVAEVMQSQKLAAKLV